MSGIILESYIVTHGQSPSHIKSYRSCTFLLCSFPDLDNYFLLFNQIQKELISLLQFPLLSTLI